VNVAGGVSMSFKNLTTTVTHQAFLISATTKGSSV
jgi:hypothetical protein